MKTKIVAAFVLCLWSAALAAPAYVNYQGLLNGANGQPLPTGNYTMEFNIYDQAQLGSRVWGPFIFDGAVAVGHGPLVPVANGRFNVIIGPQDTNGVLISAAFGGTNRYMELAVAGGPPILPRQQFLSTAYAFQAINAGSADSAASVTDTNVARRLGGNAFTGNQTVTGGVTVSGDATIQGNVTASGLNLPLSLIATNGYQELPGGILIQWGTNTSTLDEAQDFVFPRAFTTTYSVVISRMGVGMSWPLGPRDWTTNKFTIDRYNELDGNSDFSWIAVGTK